MKTQNNKKMKTQNNLKIVEAFLADWTISYQVLHIQSGDATRLVGTFSSLEEAQDYKKSIKIYSRSEYLKLIQQKKG